ncbi:hypothetical protein EJV46_12095 [Roseococcus sp. SYP-B2431]|uniref:hypothetical protein n=1 Tax=Roseococcus sp. SYP-B2431 TaxID=2496640 RepID=UPI00103CA65F|nr:hypothetical protein [Roseococcus sp. SYP-B2431]TCH97950.1 hypothetical protein EJV46_12095 [Roseococcus sp. SYP-B2431]
MRCFPLALACALVAAPAFAQDRPAVTPTRDVSVAYRVTTQGPGNGTEMRISWLAASGLMRVDMPGGQGFMVADLRGGGPGFMVMEAQRMIMDVPRNQLPPVASMQPGPNARFTREGTARVANTSCTIWRMEDQGQSGRACLTADGVMLRAEGDNRQGQVEATSVTYGPQDPARFQRPSGYQTFQLPAGIPGATGGGMPRGTALPPPGMTPPGR